MQTVNQNTAAILDLLTQGLNRLGDHCRIENNPAFMPVCVERISETAFGPIFSVVHYYEQNGDLMRDPEMTFLRLPDGSYSPLSYQQDGLGLYQESVIFDENGNPEKFIPSMQRNHALFAEQWMKNIKEQQGV